jgi:hypothetical protein
MSESKTGTVEIQVETDQPDEIQKRLKELLESEGLSAVFHRSKETEGFRSIDPGTLVAIVGAIGTSLGALVTGLFSIGKQRECRKIVVRRGETHVEIPLDASLDKVDALLALIKKSDPDNTD